MKALDEIYDYAEKRWPYDYNGSHYKDALAALGYKRDGFDQYGSNCYYKDGVRIALYYDRGDCCWCIEEAQGCSDTSDNFYNTESEMQDVFGNYGFGSYCDDWNRGAF